MRVLGLVPARGGSRRIPRKNLARLGGKTLVRRALDTAVVSGAFDLVALSTEDEEIATEATGLEGVALVRRPVQLATSDARAYDVLVHALHTLESSGHERFEAAAIVQCTSPFTAPEDLRGAVAMLRNADAASVVSVAPIDASRHPLKLKRMEGDRLVPYLADDEMTPSHELPPLWIRNGSIYVTRRTAIDAGKLVSDDVLGYRMPPERSFDIDTERDLIVAELLIARGAAD